MSRDFEYLIDTTEERTYILPESQVYESLVESTSFIERGKLYIPNEPRESVGPFREVSFSKIFAPHTAPEQSPAVATQNCQIWELDEAPGNVFSALELGDYNVASKITTEGVEVGGMGIGFDIIMDLAAMNVKISETLIADDFEAKLCLLDKSAQLTQPNKSMSLSHQSYSQDISRQPNSISARSS